MCELWKEDIPRSSPHAPQTIRIQLDGLAANQRVEDGGDLTWLTSGHPEDENTFDDPHKVGGGHFDGEWCVVGGVECPPLRSNGGSPGCASYPELHCRSCRGGAGLMKQPRLCLSLYA